MRLLGLELEGFRSFAARQQFEFPDAAGLFHVRGRNDAEPALGANGAGKTTLWEAVCWCFFGCTSRGVGAAHVESWLPSKSTFVEVVVEVDGNSNTIRRARRPNHLLLNGVEVTQDEIDDLLSMDFDRFLHVVLMGQFGTMFPDLKPTARLDLLSQALDLDLWSKAAKNAADELKRYETSIAQHETFIAAAKAKLGECERQLLEAEHEHETWWSMQKDASKALKQNIETLRDTAERREAKWKDGAVGYSKSALDGLREQQKKAQRAKEDAGLKVARLQGEVQSCTKAVRAAEQDIEAAEGLGTECPTCLRPVRQDQRSRIVDILKDTLRAAQTALGTAARAVAEASKEATAATAAHTSLSNKVDEAEKHFREEEKRAADNERELDSLHDRIEALEKQQEAAIVCPFDRQIHDLTLRIGDTEREVERREVWMFDDVTNRDLLDGWPKLFKELRLWIVDQTLVELEIAVNASMVELGLRGWRMQFAVERETAAGSVSRGFEITVHAPDSPDGVPWEAWSGGETQRLRIACAVGLANLIRSRMPSAPAFEVWDEPTAHLNREGVTDLVSYMDGRAESRQVWLVDHRALDSGAFDGVVTVVKGENGSFLETSVQ